MRAVGSYTFIDDWAVFCMMGEFIQKDSECCGLSFVAFREFEVSWLVNQRWMEVYGQA